MRRFIIPTLMAVTVILAGCSQRVDDTAITTKVKSKLAADSETSAMKISVETKDGVVTLSGAVDKDTEKNKAEQLARNTDGVKRVANNIKVEPDSMGANNSSDDSGDTNIGETLSDAAILATVKAKLVADGITGTNVDVTNGQVVLNGQVEDAREKAKAEQIAKTTAGVREVKNQLSIKKYKGA
jgi:hyperosmotically inducible protein